MSTLPAFADTTDYALRGLPQGTWTEPVLAMKLAEASRKVRARAPDVDAHIEAGKLDAALVTDIVCAMVSRAVPLEGDFPIPGGAQSMQVGVDVFQQSVRFGQGGAAALYFTKEERRTLGIGVSKVGVSDTLRPDVAPPQPEGL